MFIKQYLCTWKIQWELPRSILISLSGWGVLFPHYPPWQSTQYFVLLTILYMFTYQIIFYSVTYLLFYLYPFWTRALTVPLGLDGANMMIGLKSNCEEVAGGHSLGLNATRVLIQWNGIEAMQLKWIHSQAFQTDNDIIQFIDGSLK